MRGVHIIHDETSNKRFVQIDLEHLENSQGEVEELLDIIIAESRKTDKEISWKELKKQLKQEG